MLKIKYLSFTLVLLTAIFMFMPNNIVLAKEAPKALVLAIGGESETGYNPITGWGRYGHPLFHSTLLTRNENLDILPDLATEYKLSENRLVWHIKIRQDAKFSDNSPLTAEDVVFTFQQVATTANAFDFINFEKAVKINNYELEIHLKKPEITFIDYLIKIGIVPKALYSENYGRKPIGSGPYKFVEWREGEQLIVEINENYYGEKPFFKRVVFLFMDTETAFAAAKSGQVHLASVPQALAGQKINNMNLKAVQSVDNRGLMFPMNPPTGLKSSTGEIIGNKVTSELAIRKAINYALNRQLLVEGVLYGYGSPAYGLADGLPWDNKENKFEDNNLEKALKILKDDGWALNKNNIMEKNGLEAKIDLVYAANDPTRQALVLAVADQLKEVGIILNPISATWAEIYNKYAFNTAILYGWGDITPIELYQVYHSRKYNNQPDTSSLNVSRYHNPTVDKYLELAQNAETFEQSLSYWQKAQWDGETGPAVLGDAAWAWLVNLNHCYFVNNSLDIGTSAIENHGHGWPITANLPKWKWNE